MSLGSTHASATVCYSFVSPLGLVEERVDERPLDLESLGKHLPSYRCSLSPSGRHPLPGCRLYKTHINSKSDLTATLFLGLSNRSPHQAMSLGGCKHRIKPALCSSRVSALGDALTRFRVAIKASSSKSRSLSPRLPACWIAGIVETGEP